MEREFSEINITPFTDVLLVLLVIFIILAALVVPPGFERKLPCNCNPAPPAHQVQPVVVSITRDGAIAVNGERTSEMGLYGILQRAAARQPRMRLQIFADARARYGLVIRALDAAKGAAIGDVSFVTQ